MKKNILLVLPLCALAIACTKQATIQSLACQTVNVLDKCTSNGQKVTINVASASGLTVAPPNVCAKSGTAVNFQVKPENTDIIVVTFPKKPANKWMTGVNKPDPEFKMNVSASASKGDTFDYYIVATNGKCYDPRIEVN
jgi:hypothetical protein